MSTRPADIQASRRATSLVYADQLGALEARGDSSEVPRVTVRMPMYKANDSSDLHLMELISPSHELQRRLTEGRRPMTQQQQQQSQMHLLSASKSLDITPRLSTNIPVTKHNKQDAPKNPQVCMSFNTRFFAGDGLPARPRTAPTLKRVVHDQRRGALKKPLKKSHNLTIAEQAPPFLDSTQPFAKRMHHHLEEFEDIRIYNTELVPTRRDHQKMTTSGFNTERSITDQRKVHLKLRTDDDQKASDLRLISKLWHQECKCSVVIQQRLADLLNSKYKEAFDDGRMYTVEKCKHNDFKSEVERILKKLERAGAPQLPTLNVKHELAVACADEAFGKGMGEEYMKLEMYFMQPKGSGNVMTSARDENHVKEIAQRVQHEYEDVQNITRFMLDQLSLSEMRPDAAS